jgi:serine/threonine-protein kinase HipA
LISRSGNIYLYDQLVGTLSETIDGEYIFEYLSEYMDSDSVEGVSLTLPKTQKKYRSDSLPCFFDGLIPEGWLLSLGAKNWKLNVNDRMGLLLSTCQSTIGAVHIVENGQEPENKVPKLSTDDFTTNNEFVTDRCLITYGPLAEGIYNSKAAKKLFGDKDFQNQPNISLENLEGIAQEQVVARLTVTGVQKKISLSLDSNENDLKRFTIVDLGGDFILKPPSTEYPDMPEIEHLCMKMSKVAGFTVPECALIPLSSGELAYIVKRFDRNGDKKNYQEDFCQLMNRPTKDKYRSSIEKCSKVIKEFCADSSPNLSLFFDLNFYNYLIGNADMHLKNFSLVKNRNSRHYQLSPCYDLLSTKLLVPEDLEQTALAINGKKNKLNKNDWVSLSQNMGLSEGYFEKVLKKYKAHIPKMLELIKISFLTDANKEALSQMIVDNYEKVSR